MILKTLTSPWTVALIWFLFSALTVHMGFQNAKTRNLHKTSQVKSVLILAAIFGPLGFIVFCSEGGFTLYFKNRKRSRLAS